MKITMKISMYLIEIKNWVIGKLISIDLLAAEKFAPLRNHFFFVCFRMKVIITNHFLMSKYFREFLTNFMSKIPVTLLLSLINITNAFVMTDAKFWNEISALVNVCGCLRSSWYHVLTKSQLWVTFNYKFAGKLASR